MKTRHSLLSSNFKLSVILISILFFTSCTSFMQVRNATRNMETDNATFKQILDEIKIDRIKFEKQLVMSEKRLSVFQFRFLEEDDDFTFARKLFNDDISITDSLINHDGTFNHRFEQMVNARVTADLNKQTYKNAMKKVYTPLFTRAMIIKHNEHNQINSKSIKIIDFIQKNHSDYVIDAANKTSSFKTAENQLKFEQDLIQLKQLKDTHAHKKRDASDD